MIMTEEELRNLPKVLTEEQERQMEEEDRIYTDERFLNDFDEACIIIEEICNKYPSKKRSC